MVTRSRNTILIVDDEPAVVETHAMLVKDLGYRAMTQTDPEQVESDLKKHPAIGAVLLDIRMPGMGGMELLHRIKLRRPHMGVVMATVVNDIEHAVNSIKQGAYNYLLKPLQEERLKDVLQSYFSNQPKALFKDPRFASFITNNTLFESIFRNVKAYAEADVPVLIQGETGTGKELIANIIHSLSPRSLGPFAAVNVPALSAQLFESELFGYRRGAFTGAIQDHAGYFEEAGDGTLFLDEIGELDLDQQKKLLRVLQTRRFTRVGETKEREFRGRIVLATNRDLREDIKAQIFRDDLYYRLSSHCIDLPPLRQRGEDLDVLMTYFLRKYCSQFGRVIEGFDPEALKLLKQYSFPGNVRELEGLISSAVLLEQSPYIRPETLPSHIAYPPEPDGEDLESVRYRTIMKVMSECRGNQTRAAEKLGVSRGYLNRFLREYRTRHPQSES